MGNILAHDFGSAAEIVQLGKYDKIRKEVHDRAAYVKYRKDYSQTAKTAAAQRAVIQTKINQNYTGSELKIKGIKKYALTKEVELEEKIYNNPFNP